MQETIQINQSLTATTSGTTIYGFMGFSDSSFDSLPVSYLIIDKNNKPQKIVTSLFDIKYKIDSKNIYHYDTTIRYVTGKTIIQDFNYVLSPLQKQSSIVTFLKTVNSSTASTSSTTVYHYTSTGLTSTKITSPQFFTHVAFQEKLIDDFYTNISLVRTIDQLDTLSVHNSVINDTLTKNSPTGILFGKITALQKINDENGNKISIPLANVIVGVFNVSDEFPTVSSLDEDGNRIALNLQENCFPNLYFNNESFNTDLGLLKTDSINSVIPEKYKFTTTTNNEGEFILFDVPVGQQTFMFEVDLLKQGLTKDEVALNFFPYPTNDNPTLDTIPNLFFRQISVNVVPSWGDFQSGYTQLNVSVPLDLRKWTTYIFPPAAIAGQKLETSVSKSAANSLKIQIRDMTANFNLPAKTIHLAQITQDLDREEDQQYSWFNEFASSRRRVEYTSFGCAVLKLPANMYDPNNFKTDKDGVPTTDKKGVWLSSYQFDMFIDDTTIHRKSGAIRAATATGNAFYVLSHFKLNYTSSNSGVVNASEKIGEFPYEQPWTINYPVKYSIPRKPTAERIVYTNGRTVKNVDGNGNNVYWSDDPAFADGDLIGNIVESPAGVLVAGGFGVQSFAGAWFSNRIGQVTTKSFMYKYESGVAWNEEYANGFQPFWDASSGKRFAGFSKVIGGEQYQRLECGYGYFLKPEGWPRIIRETWNGDVPFPGEIDTGVGLRNFGDSENPGPGTTSTGQHGSFFSSVSHQNDVYNLDNQNLALCMDARSKIFDGTLDIYRIVESGPSNIATPSKFVIPTYLRLGTGGQADRSFSWSLANNGTITVTIRNDFNNTGNPNCFYYDVNGNLQSSQFGSYIKLAPGKLIFGSAQSSSPTTAKSVQYSAINLPGNDGFDPSTNKYTKATYTFEVSYNESTSTSDGHYVLPFSFDALTEPINKYIKSVYAYAGDSHVTYGLSSDGNPGHKVGGKGAATMYTPVIEDNPNSRTPQ